MDLSNPQHYCLRWNKYLNNLGSVFTHLLQNELLVDVTLSAEGKSIKCHKVVLSACSPYFEQLFIENEAQHPIIILKDIRWSDLKQLVEYMYKGEIAVCQDGIQPILQAAEALKVRGLMNIGSDDGEGARSPDTVDSKSTRMSSELSSQEESQQLTPEDLSLSDSAASPPSDLSCPPPFKRSRGLDWSQGPVGGSSDQIVSVVPPPVFTAAASSVKARDAVASLPPAALVHTGLPPVVPLPSTYHHASPPPGLFMARIAAGGAAAQQPPYSVQFANRPPSVSGYSQQQPALPAVTATAGLSPPASPAGQAKKKSGSANVFTSTFESHINAASPQQQPILGRRGTSSPHRGRTTPAAMGGPSSSDQNVLPQAPPSYGHQPAEEKVKTIKNEAEPTDLRVNRSAGGTTVSSVANSPSSRPEGSKVPTWTQTQLQEAIEAVITQKMRFTQASCKYGIPKGTLYDNILGKSKRLQVLDDLGLTDLQEMAVLEFCCEVSNMPYNRRTSKSLRDIIAFIMKLKQESGENSFDMSMRQGYRWWWAFTKKHSIISLYYDNNSQSTGTTTGTASSVANSKAFAARPDVSSFVSCKKEEDSDTSAVSMLINPQISCSSPVKPAASLSNEQPSSDVGGQAHGLHEVSLIPGIGLARGQTVAKPTATTSAAVMPFGSPSSVSSTSSSRSSSSSSSGWPGSSPLVEIGLKDHQLIAASSAAAINLAAAGPHSAGMVAGDAATTVFTSLISPFLNSLAAAAAANSSGAGNSSTAAPSDSGVPGAAAQANKFLHTQLANSFAN